jgi:hypothetical protein
MRDRSSPDDAGADPFAQARQPGATSPAIVRLCCDIRKKGTTMSSDAQRDAQADEMPANDELEEPSTEKNPGEEPRGGTEPSGDRGESEPSHQAVGIGVIGGPLVDDEAAG